MSEQKKIYVGSQLDIVTARIQGREIAKQKGFNTADQARISMAISELARILLSRNTGNPGEISVSDTHQNGHQGLQIACLVKLDHLPKGSKSEWYKNSTILTRILIGACKLADESLIEEQNDNQVWIRLTKWI